MRGVNQRNSHRVGARLGEADRREVVGRGEAGERNEGLNGNRSIR